MKLQEMYDCDFKNASKNKLLGRNMAKVKNLLLVVAFLIICAGFYFVGKKSVDHQMAK